MSTLNNSWAINLMSLFLVFVGVVNESKSAISSLHWKFRCCLCPILMNCTYFENLKFDAVSLCLIWIAYGKVYLCPLMCKTYSNFCDFYPFSSISTKLHSILWSTSTL